MDKVMNAFLAALLGYAVLLYLRTGPRAGLHAIATPLSRRFPLQQRFGPKGKISLANGGTALNYRPEAKARVSK